MTSTRGSFPRSPWNNEPVGAEAAAWRALSRDALEYVNQILDGTNNGFLNSKKQWAAVQSTADAIFRNEPLVLPDERAALLRWLGGATALCATGEPSRGGAQRIMDFVVGISMERWGVLAWWGTRQANLPDWASDLIKRVRKDVNVPPGPHSSWKKVPTGWTPDSGEGSPNAQTDMITFLYGYSQQAKAAKASARGVIVQVADIIADSCVAIRILGTTTDRVDPVLLSYMKTFENLYDHSHMDSEVLRRAGSAADRKILLGTSQNGSSHTKTPPGSGAPTARRRKL